MLTLAFAVKDAEKIRDFVSNVVKDHAQAIDQATTELENLLNVALQCLNHYYSMQPNEEKKSLFIQGVLAAVQALEATVPLESVATPEITT
jgi:hypothetical protein